MTLDEFKRKFSAIKDKGFILTKRSGTTGIGYTFEEELQLKENNVALPDIKNIEIKTHREHSNSLITLFTFNNNVWQINPLTAIKKYGSRDRNNRMGMYYTMSRIPNSAGLFLSITKKEILIQHTSGEVVAVWQLNALAERFNQKIPALLFISARTEERDEKEYFHFYRAQLMKYTTDELLGDLFKNGDIVVDLRLHDKGTSARNHGTGFRVLEANLPKLFHTIQDV